MDLEVLIPITLFICIVMAIKIAVEARFRSKLLSTGGADELLRSMARRGPRVARAVGRPSASA